MEKKIAVKPCYIEGYNLLFFFKLVFVFISVIISVLYMSNYSIFACLFEIVSCFTLLRGAGYAAKPRPRGMQTLPPLVYECRDGRDFPRTPVGYLITQ